MDLRPRFAPAGGEVPTVDAQRALAVADAENWRAAEASARLARLTAPGMEFGDGAGALHRPNDQLVWMVEFRFPHPQPLTTRSGALEGEAGPRDCTFDRALLVVDATTGEGMFSVLTR